MTLKLRSLVSA